MIVLDGVISVCKVAVWSVDQTEFFLYVLFLILFEMENFAMTVASLLLLFLFEFLFFLLFLLGFCRSMLLDRLLDNCWNVTRLNSPLIFILRFLAGCRVCGRLRSLGTDAVNFTSLTASSSFLLENSSEYVSA